MRASLVNPRVFRATFASPAPSRRARTFPPSAAQTASGRPLQRLQEVDEIRLLRGCEIEVALGVVPVDDGLEGRRDTIMEVRPLKLRRVEQTPQWCRPVHFGHAAQRITGRAVRLGL